MRQFVTCEATFAGCPSWACVVGWGGCDARLSAVCRVGIGLRPFWLRRLLAVGTDVVPDTGRPLRAARGSGYGPGVPLGACGGGRVCEGG